jgi:hypothetical protein
MAQAVNRQHLTTEAWVRVLVGYEGTTDYLISGCPTLAKNEYIMRHDEVCTHLHYSICKKLGIETAENWYSTYLSQ